jgi:hypothetical protein
MGRDLASNKELTAEQIAATVSGHPGDPRSELLLLILSRESLPKAA